MRDHKPVKIERFMGLYDRGDIDNVPLDHFSDCQNIRFSATGKSVLTRYGADKFQDVVSPLGNIVRYYNYITQSKNTLLVLVFDGTDGKIYHVIDSTTVQGPILTIAGMEDFAFVPYAGRAYISPFKSYTTGGITIQKGLQSEFLYVYLGDGTAARKAAGSTPAGTLIAANGAAGHTDGGNKNFAVVGETDSGFLSAPCAFVNFTTADLLSVSFTNVPTFTGAQWTKRHIVATKSITDYNGDLQGYEYFFIPNATINNNVGTTLSNISFYDADLLEDASHLLDDFSSLSAGCHLTLYRDRLVLTTTFTDISLVYISHPGEPESISQLDGFILVPPDGNPITNGQELRDILYLTKRNRTVGYNDNGDEPANWAINIIDNALGSTVHGIATVIDSGSTSVDFLLIGNNAGLFLFNGKFIDPPLSFKINNFWLNQNKNLIYRIQIINDSIDKIFYCVLPNWELLVADYNLGLDPKNIRYTPWIFDFQVNTVALVNINTLIMGSVGAL